MPLIKKIDGLGRVVIPKEIRKQFNMRQDTSLDIQAKDGKVFLEIIEETIECPNCKSSTRNTDIYCSQCGRKIRK